MFHIILTVIFAAVLGLVAMLVSSFFVKEYSRMIGFIVFLLAILYYFGAGAGPGL